MPRPALRPHEALSLFYLTNFAVLGAYLPYLNLYLSGIGLSGMQIGVVSALAPLSAASVPPAGGLLADHLGRRRALVIASSILALGSFALLPGARTFAVIAAILAAFSVLRAAALPIVEASAVEISESGGRPYGRMRAWGSIAFIVVSLASGRMVGTWGESLVPWIILILLGLNVLAALLLPIDRPRDGGPRPAGGLLAILRRREVLAFLAAGMLSQAAHGPYYVFYSIHLEAAGYGPQAIGLLWALAVGCEVAAMIRMPAILARFGTLPTITAALLLGALRWGICAVTTAPIPMAAAQALHAATYAAFHVAAVTHTYRLFGGDRRASGQAIYSSATYGVGNVFGMFLSGLFYDRAGGPALFAAASAVALAGALVLAAARRR